MYDTRTAIENYSICNWLRSCNDPYPFSDFKSHSVLPEYCNQCLADKTDHLEWEGFDAELTILKWKPLGFDYYILAGWLKNWSGKKVFWQSLKHDFIWLTECLKLAPKNTFEYQISAESVKGFSSSYEHLTLRPSIQLKSSLWLHIYVIVVKSQSFLLPLCRTHQASYL